MIKEQNIRVIRFPFERYVQGKPSVRAEELRYFQPSEIGDGCQGKKFRAQCGVEFRERRIQTATRGAAGADPCTQWPSTKICAAHIFEGLIFQTAREQNSF